MNRRAFLSAAAAGLVWLGLGGKSKPVAAAMPAPEEPERLVTFKGHPLVWEREYKPVTATEASVLRRQGNWPIREKFLETTRGREIIVCDGRNAAAVQSMMYGRAIGYKHKHVLTTPEGGWRANGNMFAINEEVGAIPAEQALWWLDEKHIGYEEIYVVDLGRDTEGAWQDVEGFEEILAGPVIEREWRPLVSILEDERYSRSCREVLGKAMKPKS